MLRFSIKKMLLHVIILAVASLGILNTSIAKTHHHAHKKHQHKVTVSKQKTKHHAKSKTKHKAKHSTQKHGKTHKKVVHKRVHQAQIRTEDTLLIPSQSPINLTTPNLEQPRVSSSEIGFASSIGQRLVAFVHQSVATLRYSAYKLGGSKIDPAHGIYVVDCSRYVDHVLEEVTPNAYINLVNSTGSEKPNSRHYYDFFTGLQKGPEDYWSKVDDVEQLRAGDILVFQNKRRSTAAGHVMVVMDKPVFEEDAFLVKVADSAPSGHSEDTREKKSGIGIGTLLLKVNPETGHPYAYAWKVGSYWQNNVKFAMARPAARQIQ